MKNISAYIVVILVLFLPGKSKSQSIVADTLKKRFEKFQQRNLQEKIYGHLDRTAYVTGETMWFKIFCTDATHHRLLDLSKVAYIEILHRSGKSVVNAKVELTKGEGHGSVFIPATLDSDSYIFRAYTNWMKNSSSAFFFEQPITIVNPFRKKENTAGATKPAIDAQFFAEGGNLIEGINSKVAFRIVNPAGHGMNCTGMILNSKNDTIARLATQRFGLGNLSFTPGNDSYRAVLTDENGNKFTATLPAVARSGYSLQLKDAGDNILITVRTVGVPESSTVTLLAHTRGRVFATQQLPLINGATSFRVTRSAAGDGISHFTIFDDKMYPVSERLFYKKPQSLFTLLASTDQREYGPRRKVKLSINTMPGSIAKGAAISISVHKQDSLTTFKPVDITTHLLLTSDLAGEIESPEYYLDKATSEDFENLMLTHGWSRFSWEHVNNGRADQLLHLPEVDGPILTGTVYNENGEPAPNISTFLTTPSSLGHIRNFVSDKNGRVRYVLNNIADESKLYIQTDFTRDSTFTFKMDDPFVATGKPVGLPALVLSPTQTGSIVSRSVAMQVQDIYKDNADISIQVQDSVPFYGKGDETYFLDDYTRFPVMEEVMREFVKAVWVRKRQGKFYFIMVDNVNKSIFKENPLILLDGVRIFDVNQIMALDPRLVKKIDVVASEFYLGMSTFPGIVSYYTYKGDMGGLQPHRQTLLLDYFGLQSKKEFFTPVYQTERQRSNRLPDQRSVLAWIPNATLADGKAEIEFFTSDVGGTFDVSVQALSGDGIPGSASTSFRVSDFNN